LQRCLDGLTLQTVAPCTFEVIVVDDGSQRELSSLTSRYDNRLDLTIACRPHLGVSAARNIAIELSKTPLLILGEDDVRPLPTMVEYCLAFHSNHPDEADAVLLYFTVDPSLRHNPVIHYLVDYVGHYFGFPDEPGTYGPELFWGGAISCRRSLFEYGMFDTSYSATEDTELAYRLDSEIELRVHFERIPQATFIRDISLADVMDREYRMAANRFRRHSEHPDEAGPASVWYARPWDFIIEDGAKYRLMMDTAQTMEAELRVLDSRPTPGRAAARLARLYRYYTAAIGHAAASGWHHAEREQMR